jgi:DNA-binding transcriptional MerR regulator
MLDLRVGSNVYRSGMTTGLLISELASRSGFSPSALRYYEQVGLLAADGRTSGGYRVYGEGALLRLRFIERAKQLGLPLEEIRGLVAVWDQGQCAHVQARLRAHLVTKSAEVRARIADLGAFGGQLDQALAELSQQSPDGPCGEGCGCAEPAAGASPSPQWLHLLPNRPGPSPAEIDAASPPVVCTLQAADQPERLAEWAAVLAQARSREDIPGGLRLRFAPEPELAGHLTDLATREQACCAFFSFSISPTTDGLLLDVTAPAQAVDVLAGLFGSAA